MSLANCKHCGKLFLSTRSLLCTDCKVLHNDMYREVRDYLKQHPKSTVLDVHMQTGIPIAKVLELRNVDFIPYS
jgi:hypothetical protein